MSRYRASGLSSSSLCASVSRAAGSKLRLTPSSFAAYCSRAIGGRRADFTAYPCLERAQPGARVLARPRRRARQRRCQSCAARLALRARGGLRALALSARATLTRHTNAQPGARVLDRPRRRAGSSAAAHWTSSGPLFTGVRARQRLSRARTACYYRKRVCGRRAALAAATCAFVPSVRERLRARCLLPRCVGCRGLPM